MEPGQILWKALYQTYSADYTKVPQPPGRVQRFGGRSADESGRVFQKFQARPQQKLDASRFLWTQTQFRRVASSHISVRVQGF